MITKLREGHVVLRDGASKVAAHFEAEIFPAIHSPGVQVPNTSGLWPPKKPLRVWFLGPETLNSGCSHPLGSGAQSS